MTGQDRRCAWDARFWPIGLGSTSTHDTHEDAIAEVVHEIADEDATQYAHTRLATSCTRRGGNKSISSSAMRSAGVCVEGIGTLPRCSVGVGGILWARYLAAAR